MLAIWVVTAALGVAVTSLPAPAQTATPTITVTPSTGLHSGDPVVVELSGFPQGIAVVGTCPAGATQPAQCDARHYLTVSVGADGTGVVGYQPLRMIRTTMAPSGVVDCATGGCTIGAAAGLPPSGVSAQHPIDFVDDPIAPPVLTVSGVVQPEIVDGSLVWIGASGLQPYEAVDIGQCPPGAVDLASCDLGIFQSGSANGVGSMAAQVFVRRTLRVPGAAGPAVDCGIAVCTLGVETLTGLHQVPLTFTDPGISIAVDPTGHLDVGAGEATARVTVSCAVRTPYSLVAAIEQGTTSRTATIVNRECAPGFPSTVVAAGYASAGSDPYQLGPATVSVSVAPTFDLLPDDPTAGRKTASAAVDLVDVAPIVAAIGILIADPAHADLRQLVVDAIFDRASYDPVFAARFAALISGG